MQESFRVGAAGLGAYRMFYAAFALLVIAPGHDVYASLAGFADLPSSMYTPPPGPMQLFSGFPPPLVAESIHLLLNISLVALFLGYRTRWFSVLTGALFLVLYGFSYSIGKINHNVLFVLVPLIMSASGWGSALSLDEVLRPSKAGASRNSFRQADERTWSRSLTLLGIIVGFAIFTAGFAKILGGWLDPTTHAVYGHVLKSVFVRGRDALFAPALVGFQNGFVWETLDYLTVLFEVGFLAACIHRRTLRLFAGVAVLFHFGVMVSLNIAFAFNLAVYAAFVDWDRAVARLRPSDSYRKPGRTLFSLAERAPHRTRLLGVATVLLVGVTFYAVGSPLLWLDHIFVLDSDLSSREVFVVSAGAVLVSGFGLRYGFRVVRTATNQVRGRMRRLTTP